MIDRYEQHDWDHEGLPIEYVIGDDVYVEDEYIDERWKISKQSSNYMISNKGRVFSLLSNKILKPKKADRHGHLGVCLDGDKYRYIHRMQAEMFIPNPNDYPEVRHLDDDPENNYLNNLAWGTHADNMNDMKENGHYHAITDEERELGFEKTRTSIIATDLNTGEKISFRGQGEAARILNLQQSNIFKVLAGQRKQTGGYYFEYDN